jgi:hypothetical protein
MPAQPTYFHRVGDALAVFGQMDSDWIDRRTLEETLGVSKTVAWRVLHQCGAIPGPGNTLVCRRSDLISSLERLRETGKYQQEIARRARVEDRLTQLLAAARSQHIAVARSEEAEELVSTRFGELPTGVELTPTRLTIDFSGTQDFLQKFGAVVFALQNDYEQVSDFIEQRSAVN